MVDFSKYKTKETTTSGVTDFSKYASNQVNAEELALDGFANIEPNYFQRVGGQYQKAGQDIMGAISTGAESLQKADGSLQSLLQPVRTALRTVGGVAGSAFAPILEAPLIKPLTEKIVGRVAENPEVASVIKSATELSQKYPGASKDLQNIFDIATLGYGKTVESPLKKELGAIGGDIAEATKIVLTPSEEAVQKKVVSLFNKSIKPTAKKTLAQGQRYENDTLNALRTIKTNTPSLNILDDTGELIEGRTPQTIQELAQGLDQTKDIVFKQYDNLAKQAGTSGAVIDAKPIADEVAKVAQSKALQLTNPDIIKYAEQWSERLRAFDVLDTETTQEVIKLMNNNLQSFYKTPTYESASKVAVDAGIANNFRQALDKAIEGATGEQYQVLKNQYSALKAIENDVVRASMREARKNTKGLIDYTDILTSGQMVAGILSLNPAMFTKGAIERGFKEYIKFLNDPNRAIKNIFDKLDTGRSTTFNPASETGKFLKNPKLGLSIDDVTKSDPLIQEAKKYKSAEEFVKAKQPITHYTSERFDKFDLSKTEAGSVWFTDNPNINLKTGQGLGSAQVGTGGAKYKMNRYINPKSKIIDIEKSDLTDKYTTGQLIDMGYSGVKVPQLDGSNWYEIWEPNKDLLTKYQLEEIWKKANKK